MNVTTVGIDLARNVFSVHGVDARGKVVLKQAAVELRSVPTQQAEPLLSGGIHIGRLAVARCVAIGTFP